MTHIIIASGNRTGIASFESDLTLTRVVNANTFGAIGLSHQTPPRVLNLTKVNNVNTFGALGIQFPPKLTLTPVVNVNTFGAINLVRVAALTSYANPGGIGNRTSLITITSTVVIGGGTLTNFVDGAFANNNTDALWFSGSQSLKEIKFNFTPLGARIINEAKWYQDLNNNHGVWKWQGSNDNSVYTDIGSTFTLGGVAGTQIHTQLSGNTTAYLYYKLLQVSGVTSPACYEQEIEFKISP